MTNEQEVVVLKERLDQHKLEQTAHREADGHERRETRATLGHLNENMILLTSAVTEWKTRDIMFERRLEKTEHKLEVVTEAQHKTELRLVAVEGKTKTNTKANDAVAAVWSKITVGLVLLALVGGLMYKMTGG